MQKGVLPFKSFWIILRAIKRRTPKNASEAHYSSDISDTFWVSRYFMLPISQGIHKVYPLRKKPGW